MNNYNRTSSAYKLSQKMPEKAPVKKAAAKKKKHSFKPIRNALVVALVAFAILFRYAVITERNGEINDMKAELTAINDEIMHIQLAIDKSIDLKKVESIAVGRLGLQRPEKYQIIYVDNKRADYVQIPEKKEEEQNVLGQAKAVFANILEYLY